MKSHPRVLFLLSGEGASKVLTWLAGPETIFHPVKTSHESSHPFQVGFSKSLDPSGFQGSVVQVSTDSRTGLPSAELQVDVSRFGKKKTVALLEFLARFEVGRITMENNGVPHE
jgi:hypothetical protein